MPEKDSENFVPPEFRPKPLWRRLLSWAILGGVIYGIYYTWQTGDLLKAFEWLMSQDVMVLTGIAVFALIALILGFKGV